METLFCPRAAKRGIVCIECEALGTLSDGANIRTVEKEFEWETEQKTIPLLLPPFLPPPLLHLAKQAPQAPNQRQTCQIGAWIIGEEAGLECGGCSDAGHALQIVLLGQNLSFKDGGSNIKETQVL